MENENGNGHCCRLTGMKEFVIFVNVMFCNKVKSKYGWIRRTEKAFSEGTKMNLRS